jgi:hypothetical protein
MSEQEIKVDRSKCKAPEWCGFRGGDDSDPRWRAWMIQCEPGVCSATHRYCSPACRDARLPVVEAKRICIACEASGPNVQMRYVRKVTKPVLRCDPCMLRSEIEAEVGMAFTSMIRPTGVLRNADRPALIDRRLFHVADGDLLPEAGR